MAGVTRWAAGTIALLMLAGVLAAGALARVARPDRTPPTFAGLKSATTCVPGPIDGQAASYQLSWDPATDDVTPSAQIVYDIYQATKSTCCSGSMLLCRVGRRDASRARSLTSPLAVSR